MMLTGVCIQEPDSGANPEEIINCYCEGGGMVDAGDLKSPAFGRVGSSPISRTIIIGD